METTFSKHDRDHNAYIMPAKHDYTPFYYHIGYAIPVRIVLLIFGAIVNVVTGLIYVWMTERFAYSGLQGMLNRWWFTSIGLYVFSSTILLTKLICNPIGKDEKFQRLIRVDSPKFKCMWSGKCCKKWSWRCYLFVVSVPSVTIFTSWWQHMGYVNAASLFLSATVMIYAIVVIMRKVWLDYQTKKDTFYHDKWYEILDQQDRFEYALNY